MEYYQIPEFTDGVDVLNSPLRGSMSACLKTQNLIPVLKGILRKRDGFVLYKDFSEEIGHLSIQNILCFQYYKDLDCWVVIFQIYNANDRIYVKYNNNWYGDDWQDLGTKGGKYQIEKFLNDIYFIDGEKEIRVIKIENNVPVMYYLKNTPNALNVPQGKYLKFFKDRLWVADDYNIYFSKNLIFNQFEANNIVNLPTNEKTTGIEVITRNVLTQNIADFLFIGRENSGYIISFTTQLDYLIKIFSGVEVINQRCITNCPYGLAFVSRDNIYLLDMSLNLVSIGDLISPILDGTLYERSRDNNKLDENFLIFYNGFLRLGYIDITGERKEFHYDMRNKGSQGWYGEQILNLQYYAISENTLYGSLNDKIYRFAQPWELCFTDDGAKIPIELWTKYYSITTEFMEKIFKRLGIVLASQEQTNVNIECLINQGENWQITNYTLEVPASIPRYDRAVFDIDKFYLAENIWKMMRVYLTQNARGKFIQFRLLENSDTIVIINNGIIGYLPTGRIL